MSFSSRGANARRCAGVELVKIYLVKSHTGNELANMREEHNRSATNHRTLIQVIKISNHTRKVHVCHIIIRNQSTPRTISTWELFDHYIITSMLSADVIL